MKTTVIMTRKMTVDDVRCQCGAALANGGSVIGRSAGDQQYTDTIPCENGHMIEVVWPAEPNEH